MWLESKPFSSPPTYELARCLRSFAHIVEGLSLGHRAAVLDVGCGPGWLSEWLARCGYRVTGIDISEEMIGVARKRTEAMEPLSDGLAPSVEFLATPVHDLPWSDRFDAAVLYDAMHHFHDEHATLQAIRRALVPGGLIYIHEGVRPAPGSEGERELIEEMERYGTLESPFDGDYLEQVVKDAGFTEVRRYVEVDMLADLADPRGVRARLRRRMASPETNTLTAMNPIPREPGAARYEGRVEPLGDWYHIGPRDMAHKLTITNTGAAVWPASREFPPPAGTVNVGPYLQKLDGTRDELPRVTLPHSVPPGSAVEIEVRVSRERAGTASEIHVDLVHEQISWFNEAHSPPFTLPIAGGPGG